MIARRVAVAWIASAAWLLALSSWLGVAPGRPVVSRNNVLFQVDVASHYRELAGRADPFSPGKPRVSAPHPFLPQVWGTVGAGTAWLLSPVGDAEARQLLAARLTVAAVAAAGLAALAWLATVEGVAGPWLACVLAVAWFSSSMTIVALPDHFGLSYGLLLLTFAGGWASVTRGEHAWWAWAAGALAVATTVTNAVFVGVIFAWMAWRPARAAWTARSAGRKWTAGAAAALVAVLLTAAAGAVIVPKAVRRIASGETIVTKYFHGGLVHSPGASLVALPLTLTYPTVAATPRIASQDGQEGVTLEPWRVADYTPLAALGAVVVLACWAAGVALAARPGAGRQAVAALSAWVAFNWAFHSVWGDERFLYSPHWAWVFPAVLVLAARGGPVPRWLWPAVGAIVAAELASLSAIAGLAGAVR